MDWLEAAKPSSSRRHYLPVAESPIDSQLRMALDSDDSEHVVDQMSDPRRLSPTRLKAGIGYKAAYDAGLVSGPTMPSLRRPGRRPRWHRRR